jgi:hypothetical protein
MYVLCALLVGGLIANFLVRPLADKWFMPEAEVAALQAKSAAAAERTGSFGIGRGGLDAKAVVAWAIVGIPILWGVWMTLQKTAALF